MARVQNAFVQHVTNKGMIQIIYSKVKKQIFLRLKRIFKMMLWARRLIDQIFLDIIGWERHVASTNLKAWLILSNNLNSGFVKFYITQINKSNTELGYQSLSSGKLKWPHKIYMILTIYNSDFLIPLRRQTHSKHDIRDRGKKMLSSFSEAKDFPFFLTRDRGKF